MDRLKSGALRRFVKSTPLGPFAARTLRRYRSHRGDQSAYIEEDYDRFIVKVMERVLEKDSNCVDAGAHVGKFLREMVRLSPSGRHHAFEPLPALALRLARDFPSVRVKEMALSDVAGTKAFRHVLSDEGFSGFERRSWDTYEEVVELIDVEVRTLDDVLPPDLPIRFIKVDVEGSEYRLLRGARRTLQTHEPFVAFELGENQVEVFDFLTEIGLKVSRLDGWLSSRPALDRAGFEAEVRKLTWTFLAHPLAERK